MIDFCNKDIIALPDSRPGKGLGHVIRTINLLCRFNSAKSIYLVTEDSPEIDVELGLSFIHYPKINLIPKRVLASNILVVFDSYDCAKCASVYQSALSLFPSSQIRFLSICDTYNQAKSMIELVPSTDLLFPNLITHQLRSNLSDLCVDRNCNLYHGYSYILLDKVTVETSIIPNLRPRLNGQGAVCLVSFGFSSFLFTPKILAHAKKFLERIMQQSPSIQFYLLGPNALQLFLKLGMSNFIAKYHQFLSKSSLIKLYDSSSIYFGSLGYSMWERAFRLLPSFVYPIAENQRSYVQVGKIINIHCSSFDVLKNDFNFTESISSMYHGTLKFKEAIMKSRILR